MSTKDQLAQKVTEFRTKHPAGLWLLFFAEMWERFSYYGMRALLVLYMTSQALNYPDKFAKGVVYAGFTALVYAVPVLGGYLADKFIGTGRAIVFGGLLMAAGNFSLSFEGNEIAFYIGLALLCIGNGFFKPNISTTVGRLYAEKDPMRDRGFSVFYQGINLGAFLSPLICGYLGEVHGWKYGFMAAGVGMLLGVVTYMMGRHVVEGHDLPPTPDAPKTPLLGMPANLTIMFGSFVAVPLCAVMLWKGWIGNLLLPIAIGIYVYCIAVAVKSDRVTRDRIFMVLILFLCNILFWALFEQAGSSLNTYARDVVNRDIGGVDTLTSWYQSVNAIFIVALAPVFSAIWMALRKIKKMPSIPAKFGLGIIQLGVGYYILVVGAEHVDGTGRVLAMWLILCYLLHTTGELCLSPVGLSAVTKLCPTSRVGFFMGAWFLSIAIANFLGGKIATLTGDSSQYEVAVAFDDSTKAKLVAGDRAAWDDLAALNSEADRLSRQLNVEVARTDVVSIDPAKPLDENQTTQLVKRVSTKLSNIVSSLQPAGTKVEFVDESGSAQTAALNYSPKLLALVNQNVDAKLNELEIPLPAADIKLDAAAALDDAALLAATTSIRAKVDLLIRGALDGYTDVYKKSALVCIAIGILFVLLSPLMNRLTHGIE
jgi:proton-dependent oligopeptide transporter, POT family